MRRYYLGFAFPLFAALIAVSCNTSEDHHPAEDGYGTLDLSSLAVSTVDVKESTRAVATDDFVLRVWDEHNTLVAEWNAFSSRPADYKLNVGDYTLEVCSPEHPDADWETPWYVGRAQFTIQRNLTTDIGTVVCSLGNIKVTVRYSEGLEQYIADDARVTISVGDGTLVFGRNEKQAAYFRAPGETNDMTVSFAGTIDGVYETLDKVLQGVKPGEWERVRFTYSEVAGQHTFCIYVGGFLIGQITPGSDWGIIN